MCCMHQVEVEGANNCSEYVGAVNTDSGYTIKLEPYGIVVSGVRTTPKFNADSSVDYSSLLLIV